MFDSGKVGSLPFEYIEEKEAFLQALKELMQSKGVYYKE
jgi:hypothetical protein